jgi:RNA polymerase sigma-70 factor (ECF subfamily)
MRAYQDMVFSTAARLTGNDAQAEDIAQDVFLKAFQNFEHLRTSPTAGGWLKTVATRLTLNHLTRYRRRWRFFSELSRDAEDETHEPDVATSGRVTSDPAAANLTSMELVSADLMSEAVIADIDADKRHELVEQALRQLPEHQRVPLVLYHFEEIPYAQIAEQLRVSLPKVKTDIQRARAAMAKILARSGLVRASVVG